MSFIDSSYIEEFQLKPDLIYLNHAGVSPWPVRTQTAILKFTQENIQQGAQSYPHWLNTEHTLRVDLARLINAPSSDDIALVKNTSEGLSLVAYGLPWQAGDSIVIPAEEFPSNRIVWESLQPLGVTVRKVAIANQHDPENVLLAACDTTTRLLSVSSVQFARGLRLNLDQLGDYCRRHHILFCIDGIQSLGAIKCDVQSHQADFITADGHKWLLAPEGLGLFYCRAEIRERLRLRQFGWHMRENMSDYTATEWHPAATARRFEPGSPNMLGIHALHASVALLLEIGTHKIEQTIVTAISEIMQQIQANAALEILTDSRTGRYGGIVTFRHRNIPAEKIYQVLMENDVICALRGGGIRFSPHFYFKSKQQDELMYRLNQAIA